MVSFQGFWAPQKPETRTHMTHRCQSPVIPTCPALNMGFPMHQVFKSMAGKQTEPNYSQITDQSIHYLAYWMSSACPFKNRRLVSLHLNQCDHTHCQSGIRGRTVPGKRHREGTKELTPLKKCEKFYLWEDFWFGGGWFLLGYGILWNFMISWYVLW